METIFMFIAIPWMTFAIAYTNIRWPWTIALSSIFIIVMIANYANNSQPFHLDTYFIIQAVMGGLLGYLGLHQGSKDRKNLKKIKN